MLSIGNELPSNGHDGIGIASRAFIPWSCAIFLRHCQRLPNQNDRGIVGVRGNCKAEFTAHPQHRVVLAQDLADQFADAPLPGTIDKAGHQQKPDTAAFPITADRDRVFGPLFVRIGKEMGDSQRDPIALGEQRHFPVVVEL
jgi:hypothetical protein